MPAFTERRVLMITALMAVALAVPAESGDRLRVVTTTTDLAAIAAALYNSVASLVGGIRVEIPDLQPRWSPEREDRGDEE